MSFEVQQNVLLAPYTTLKIGGLAKYFSVVKTEGELVEACDWAKKESQKIFILGGGSNVLVSDEGFKGLVVLVDIKGRSYRQENDRQEIMADIKAGELWDDLVLESVNKGYSGAECLSGIPGKVGASVVQNIGAYGQEVREIIEKVRFYDTRKQEFGEYSKEECGFEYRGSIFKGRSNRIVTSVQFKLSANKEPCLRYKELMKKFSDSRPTLKQVREVVLELRKSKSMLIDPNDPNSISAGSFFNNPVVADDIFEKIKEKYPDAPNWPQGNGSIKLSAGWLIEESGLPKGFIYKDGKVGLSQKHALAIINRGGARASDVYKFAEFIKKSVFDIFGVKLQPEVLFIGILKGGDSK
ncbi:MAG: UDP-N-acetylmuramate dehydrogenase [Patescibacteria group bacterium]